MKVSIWFGSSDGGVSFKGAQGAAGLDEKIEIISSSSTGGGYGGGDGAAGGGDSGREDAAGGGDAAGGVDAAGEGESGGGDATSEEMLQGEELKVVEPNVLRKKLDCIVEHPGILTHSGGVKGL